MSHLTKIKVQIKNGEILHQALQELGYKIEYNALVADPFGNTKEAEYVIRRPHGYDWGFRRDGETYEILMRGGGLMPQNVMNEINHKYAHKTLMATAKEQGFTVEEEEIMVDGTLRVVVGRWV
ncbi:DUF1257 domain-containing protein [Microcoleus sp. FACHB-831]|uniref:DUF1257 domain-containing protein n=1 Tax=Microcoleus sp. FACHB-831 TaxID=2692827 RepID=UPI001686C5E8|nr:DUF1257 domain-containing protein [Microcoleus sp. FACHB-831]MBD1923512.1 DUF1257 domain-containing protein [Microcoleus sp. FACHB-831]